MEGDLAGIVDTTYTFSATVLPSSATTPITYTWTPEPADGQGTPHASYAWQVAGSKTISVAAANAAGSAAATCTIEISVPPAGVSVSGVEQGIIAQAYTFTAAVTPDTTTTPIDYTWTPEPDDGQGTPQAAYTWWAEGEHTIAVTATNVAGAVAGTHHVTAYVPLSSVTLAGPADGILNGTYPYTATISPITASVPITYTWWPEPASGQGTPYVVYAWLTGGLQAISVTVSNPASTVSTSTNAGVYVPVLSASITGDLEGVLATPYTFTATVLPPDTSPPITYTWMPTPTIGQDTANATYLWNAASAPVITLTAQNPGGQAVATHTMLILEGAMGDVTPETGGTLDLEAPSGGGITVEAPPGAVTGTAKLLYQAAISVTEQPAEFQFAGRAFSVDAYRDGTELTGFRFERPVTITLLYTDAEIAGLVESSLTLFTRSGTAWIDAATSCVPASVYFRQPDANSLSVAICHLSQFGLFGQVPDTNDVYMPVVIRVR